MSKMLLLVLRTTNAIALLRSATSSLSNAASAKAGDSLTLWTVGLLWNTETICWCLRSYLLLRLKTPAPYPQLRSLQEGQFIAILIMLTMPATSSCHALQCSGDAVW